MLGLWLGGDAATAYAWGHERLAEDPTNETLASYLPQVAAMLPGIEDPLAGIPADLRENEMIRVSEAVFWRGRDAVPEWWPCARRGAELFPGSRHLVLMRAFADLDEIARDEDLQRFQIPTDAQRERLGACVVVLDAYWTDRPHALHNRFDDASHALACAMVAHQILQDGDRAIERATRIADLGLTETQVLANAVQVAFAWHRADLARRLVALAPDDPDLAFHSAIIAVQDGDWDLAVRRFASAVVPEHERVMVDTVAALAQIKAGADDAPTLDAVRAAAAESPRALVLVARIATDLGEADLARLIYRQAVESVDGDSHIATRLMVASLAEEIGTPSDVIDLLDRRLPVHGYPREHAWLAVAHANERPHRRRNLAFFERLTPEARRRHEIARAHASVLLDVGKVAEALGLLRRLHDEAIEDAYVSLRLVEALRRAGDGRGADRVLRTVPLDQARGTPEFIMMLVRAVDANGEPERAYRAAYELIRKHPDRPDLARPNVCGPPWIGWRPRAPTSAIGPGLSGGSPTSGGYPSFDGRLRDYGVGSRSGPGDAPASQVKSPRRWVTSIRLDRRGPVDSHDRIRCHRRAAGLRGVPAPAGRSRDGCRTPLRSHRNVDQGVPGDPGADALASVTEASARRWRRDAVSLWDRRRQADPGSAGPDDAGNGDVRT